jgi:transcriptional regulator with XRE-family HTH domain
MSGATRRASATLSLREVFARNVRLVRIHVGQSQEKLADEAGLDRTFVSSLERGVRNISIDNIELLARALDVPAHELLDPELPEARGLDESVTRAPRKARPYSVRRRGR